jgi:hypothetical protein
VPFDWNPPGLSPGSAVFIAMLSLGATGCGVPRVGVDAGVDSGFVAGELDTHCTLDDGGVKVQPTSRASCHLVDPDAGAPEPGAVRFNAEADDDDCKYHVTVRSSAVEQNHEMSLFAVVTSRVDGAPVAGANVMPEMWLSDAHLAPWTNPMSMESPAGTYEMMPLVFDAPGRWTVKLHIFGTCTDVAEDSPHAHVAFYFDVP